MSAERKHSVLIIGSGITGLSTAYHLRQLGIRDYAIIADRNRMATQSSPGILTGGSTDNFTRLHHAWGPEFAKEIWHFGNESFRLITEFCETHEVGLLSGPRLRFTTDEPEKKEMKTASTLLKEAGFESKFDFPATNLPGSGIPGKPVTSQEEPGSGGVIDPDALRRQLMQAIGEQHFIQARATALTPGAYGIEAKLDDESVISGEMVVVATHLHIPELVPALEPALVSYADQWHRVRFRSDFFSPSWIGTVFSLNHGYAWGAVTSAREAILGGGRQMRKFAGFEATETSVSDRSYGYLLKKLGSLMGEFEAPELIRSEGVLDCRPCDEIPIIGPMFGETRILVGTGYSGSGLTHGFHAGKCLAQLIAAGSAATLPLRFHPSRLRSLAD